MTAPFTKMIFVNLPVTDVAASTAFYEAIGFTKNEAFSNAQAAAMSWADAIHFMLLDHAFYATFSPKRIIDAHTESGALIALSLESREAVDAFVAAAIDAGGKELQEPTDHGFMYERAFADPDGHGFGPFWMDPVAAANVPENKALFAGRVLTGLSCLALAMDGFFKLVAPQAMIDNSPPLGLPADLGLYRLLGAILLASVALHLWRRTALLGAILVTAFLGGAIAVNVRAGMPLLSNTLFGVYVGLIFWAGYGLRDPRIRAAMN